MLVFDMLRLELGVSYGAVGGVVSGDNGDSRRGRGNGDNGGGVAGGAVGVGVGNGDEAGHGHEALEELHLEIWLVLAWEAEAKVVGRGRLSE